MRNITKQRINKTMKYGSPGLSSIFGNKMFMITHEDGIHFITFEMVLITMRHYETENWINFIFESNLYNIFTYLLIVDVLRVYKQP